MSAPETAQYIQEYKAWLEEDSAIPPTHPPYLDRHRLISDQARRRSDLAAGGVRFFLSVVGFAKHSSTTTLENLTPIKFSDMLVRRVHVGRYLLCRIIAPCSRLLAVQSVVEDVDGIAYDISIYNFPSTFECTLEHLDALFPLGGILAIREPTFKAPTQGDRPLLRVDSPSDITFVTVNSPLTHGLAWQTGGTVLGAPALPDTIDAWQRRGNAHFKASQWFLAAWAYSHALALNPAAAIVRLNRAEAYLRLHYYSGAQCDAQSVLLAENVSPDQAAKAAFRLAKAKYGRKQYADAEDGFLRWKETHPHDSAADSWIEKCNTRRKESASGQYDWAKLYLIAKSKIRLDVADFVGPIVVGKMTHRGGGRGVVATKDVQAGELLLVAKPFVSVYSSDLPSDRILATLDLISGMSKERTDSLLLSRIIEKLYGNPDMRDEVYHLYAGPMYPSPPDDYPPTRGDPIPVDLLSPTSDIDISQLEAICTYNNFSPTRLEAPQVDSGPHTQPTGLYPLASLFNHACAATAVWYCMGDVLTVRAAAPIPAGAEVTIPYNVEPSYAARATALKKHMLGDPCACTLCAADRADGEARLAQRDALAARAVGGSLGGSALSLEDARAFERAVRDTYAPTRGAVRPLGALALHALAEKLRATGEARLARDAIRADVGALRCYGLDVPERADAAGARDVAVGTERLPVGTTLHEPAAVMLRIAGTYLGLGEDESAVPWVRAALWLTDASVGGGKRLFMLLHGDVMEEMGVREFVERVL